MEVFLGRPVSAFDHAQLIVLAQAAGAFARDVVVRFRLAPPDVDAAHEAWYCLIRVPLYLAHALDLTGSRPAVRALIDLRAVWLAVAPEHLKRMFHSKVTNSYLVVVEESYLRYVSLGNDDAARDREREALEAVQQQAWRELIGRVKPPLIGRERHTWANIDDAQQRTLLRMVELMVAAERRITGVVRPAPSMRVPFGIWRRPRRDGNAPTNALSTRTSSWPFPTSGH